MSAVCNLEEAFHRKPAMLAPSSWTSSLQNCKKIDFCCLQATLGVVFCYSSPNQSIHVCVLVTKLLQSCLTLCNPMGHHCLWNSSGKNTGIGCHALFQGIFLNPGIKPASLTSPALAGRFFTTGTLWEALLAIIMTQAQPLTWPLPSWSLVSPSLHEGENQMISKWPSGFS